MKITASLVKELREKSGAGMMDCKKALVAAEGDIDLAIQKMRESGALKAEKKSNRTTAEGVCIILSSDDKRTAVILEVNCETDFVARDDNFNEYTQAVAKLALTQRAESVDALSAMTLDSGDSVEEARKNLVAKIGENIQLRRLAIIETEGVVGAYIHGGRIGVLVDLHGGDENLAKDIAMHIAASKPLVVAREDVSQELVDKEREIFTVQAKESGKPEEIIAKMIDGRINKYLDEVSLMGQAFVKDPNQKVGQLLKSAGAQVKSFLRFEVGEGIEKKQENFAEEVMAQVRES